MVEIIEGKHRLSDGHTLYTKTWKPDSPAEAKLIFVHGFSDHCNRYDTLFPTLASQSIHVFSFDQRGWGRSVRRNSQKGHTGPTSLVLSDLSHIINSQLSLDPLIPTFVMGHSMGGAEVLTLASSSAHRDLTGRIRGWLTESAHLAFTPTAQPSAIEIFLGRLVSHIIPTYPLHKPVNPSTITRNPAVQLSLKADPLCHNIGTLQCFTSILDRAHNLNTGKRKLNDNVTALWMAHGSGDEVSDYGASERFLAGQKGVEDRVFRGYEGWGHQMHAELDDGSMFAGDVAGWILDRCGDGMDGSMEKRGL